jgi:hypothetical protein
VKQSSKSPVRWGDLIRSVVYQTLPYFGVACIWVGAWSSSMESTVAQKLEPHENNSIYPTYLRAQLATQHSGQPLADVDQN